MFGTNWHKKTLRFLSFKFLPPLKDPKVRELFKTIKTLRQWWAAEQTADMESMAKDLDKKPAPNRLEEDCFEPVDSTYRSTSTTSLSSASTPGSTFVTPGKHDDTLPEKLDIEMTEEQAKMLDDLMADIKALEIHSNPESPEPRP